MNKIGQRVLRWVLIGVVTLPLFAFYSGCVTDVQMQDFARSQAALVITNAITSQITAALTQLNQDLVGPQVTDETILTPTGAN
jgi:hypothetical protein